jgi:hypothetical protein
MPAVGAIEAFTDSESGVSGPGRERTFLSLSVDGEVDTLIAEADKSADARVLGYRGFVTPSDVLEDPIRVSRVPPGGGALVGTHRCSFATDQLDADILAREVVPDRQRRLEQD